MVIFGQFNTGDDCIAIDSGKGTDTQFGPCENVVVQNCRMHSGHGALTLGSIMSLARMNRKSFTRRVAIDR